VRRNSLRSLRELRSDKAPQVRSTKRASRADPEAALLGAAEIAAAGMAPARCAPSARAARPPPAALDAWAEFGARIASAIACVATSRASTSSYPAKVRTARGGRPAPLPAPAVSRASRFPRKASPAQGDARAGLGNRGVATCGSG